MFRKLTERVSSALGGNGNGGKVRSLVNMGFGSTEAKNALEATDGNVDRAAELLLLSSGGRGDSSVVTRTPRPEVVDLTSSPPTRPSSSSAADDMLQVALQESLASEQDRRRKTATAQPTRPTGPEQQLKPLRHRSKEQILTRHAARLASHPRAVDTLLLALTALKNDPANVKYRTIDQATPGYVATFPARINSSTEDVLTALNFQRHGSRWVVPESAVDLASLWLAISALERVRTGPEYAAAHRELKFQHKVRALLAVDESCVSAAELARRRTWSRQLCAEPDGGGGVAVVYVRLLPDRVLRRRFDGDDQLRDVVAWLGATSSGLADELTTDDDDDDGTSWCLVDQVHGDRVLDCTDARTLNLTLQRLGCWPSGRLALRERSVRDRPATDLCDALGVTRGLGVAVSSSEAGV